MDDTGGASTSRPSRNLRGGVRKSYAGQDEGPANWSTKHFDDDESDQEEEELPHKKRGRPPAAGKTVQQKSPNAHAALPGHNKKRGRPPNKPVAPLYRHLPPLVPPQCGSERLKQWSDELEALPDDTTLRITHELEPPPAKRPASSTAASGEAAEAGDADAAAAAAAPADDATAAADTDAVMADAPAPAPVPAGPELPPMPPPTTSNLHTPKEGLCHLISSFYFLKSFADVLESPGSIKDDGETFLQLQLPVFDAAMADGDHVLIHRVHIGLLTFMARSCSESERAVLEEEECAYKQSEFVTVSDDLAEQVHTPRREHNVCFFAFVCASSPSDNNPLLFSFPFFHFSLPCRFCAASRCTARGRSSSAD